MLTNHHLTWLSADQRGGITFIMHELWASKARDLCELLKVGHEQIGGRVGQSAYYMKGIRCDVCIVEILALSVEFRAN